MFYNILGFHLEQCEAKDSVRETENFIKPESLYGLNSSLLIQKNNKHMCKME